MHSEWESIGAGNVLETAAISRIALYGTFASAEHLNTR